MADIAGNVYGRLTVLGKSNVKEKWCCVCACGLYTLAERSNLRAGRTKSCGCLEAEVRQQRKYKVVVGATYGILTVIAADPIKTDRLKWRCRCECGQTKSVAGNYLIAGSTVSCGCLRRTATHARYQETHESWRKAKERCYDPSDDQFERYGARGITMCDRWRNNFAAFLKDMGLRPPGLTIDRKDNDGPYSPDNCRWATASEQALNRTERTHCQRGHPFDETNASVDKNGWRRCRKCAAASMRASHQRRQTGTHRILK